MSGQASATKPLLAALRGQVAARPPFWFMRQAGRYLPEYRAMRAKAKDFVALCLTPELASEITLQPIRRYGMDAAILFSDILMVPHGLGIRLEFREGEGPVLEPVRSTVEIDRLRLDPQRFVAALAPVFETVRRVRSALDSPTTLIGFAGAPWTVASYMVEGSGSRDFALVKRLAYAEPELFQRLIDVLIDATVVYLQAQIAAGAEVVQLFDSWAGALGSAQFERWAVAPMREITRRLRELHPEVPIIGFPRGAGIQYRGFTARTGVTAVSLDWSIPPLWAAAELQPHAPVQGNLDPLLLVAGGATMEEEARRILDALGHGPFIFNLGHGIVPETDPAQVERLCALIRGWRIGA